MGFLIIYLLLLLMFVIKEILELNWKGFNLNDEKNDKKF
jgi:hypothetical protein